VVRESIPEQTNFAMRGAIDGTLILD
jgi:hypothetical protein